MQRKLIKFKLIHIIFLLGFSFSIFINNIAYAYNLKIKDLNSYYIGIESGTYYTSFRKNYGDNLFEKELPTAHLFIGIILNNNFGVEFGHQSTVYGTRVVRIGPPEKYLGEANFGLIIGEKASCFTFNKITGWHLGITNTYPFKYNNSNHFRNYLSWINYIGLKKTKIILDSKMCYTSVFPVQIEDDNLNKKNSKFLLRMSTGIGYTLPWKHFSCRIMFSLENTCRLQPTTQRGTLQAKLKDSYSCQFGLLWEK